MAEVRTRITVIDKATKNLNNIYNSVNKVNSAFQLLQRRSTKISNNLNKTNVSVNALKNNLSGLAIANVDNTTKQVNNLQKATDNANRSGNRLVSTLKRLAATYLGVMGARATFQTSDTLTSANNKFTTFGTMRGGMDDATANTFSQEAQAKIFNAAQSSASDYAAMMSNVAKSITLASDAFGDTADQQLDTAIRFQEIMAKSYALGGASAAEQASSMYQMVQALGSGVLQGDELRSVREGAPLAYQAIEEFAQGVFKTDDALKEMASDGLITSDIVVAAIMNMGDATDAAFKKIDLTWTQLWTKFKNEVVWAFKPFFEKLREIANSDSFQQLIKHMVNALRILGSALVWVADGVQNVLDFMSEHWETFRNIAMGALTMIVTYMSGKFINTVITTTSKFIKNFNKANIPLLIMGTLLSIVIIGAIELTDAGMNLSDALGILTTALFGVAFAIALVWAIATGGVMAIVYAVLFGLLLMAGLFLLFPGFFMATANVAKAIGINIGKFFVKLVKGIGQWFIALRYNAIALFNNLYDAITTVVPKMVEAISNGLGNIMKEQAATVSKCVANILSALKSVAEFANKTLGVFGFNIDTSGLTSSISNYRAAADAAIASKKEIPNIGELWNEQMSNHKYMDMTDAFSFGWNSTPWEDLGEAWNEGMAAGDKFKNWLNGLPEEVANKISNVMGGLIPDLNPSMPDISGDIGDIADNTGSMAKSMETSEQDLDYLRQLAEKEAINKFTTAEIRVDMSNYNSINGDQDLDGIVTKLTDKLKEELAVTASGVYA